MSTDNTRGRGNIRLDPAKVPAGLRPLIPFAERFGIEDEDQRRGAIRQLTDNRLAQLRKTVKDYEPLFDEWLAGPEADGDEQTDEYVAFTYLRIAAEGY